MEKKAKHIIAFGGRLQSGKSELSKVCEEMGYQKFYFALPLKMLICSLRSISIDELNEQKNANYEYVMQNMDFKFIANETQIPFNVVKDKLQNIVFHNSRDLLQIIGTDLIREYNQNWHVNRLKEMIDNCENDKIVIEDVRFQNEYDLIKEMGGTLWFIVRPDNLNVSHHASEESLTWKDFDNIIVNRYSLEYLKLNWKLFLEQYDYFLNARTRLIDKINNTPTIKHVVGNDKVNEEHNYFSLMDMLLISPDQFSYKESITDNIIQEGIILENLYGNALTTEDLKKHL